MTFCCDKLADLWIHPEHGYRDYDIIIFNLNPKWKVWGIKTSAATYDRMAFCPYCGAKLG